MINKLARYRAPDILKKEIFNILINNIESDLIQDWNKTFEKLDVDHSGMIKIKELVKMIEKTGKFKAQLGKLKELNKKNPHLKIKYSEFLLRIVDIRKEVKHEDIYQAFKRIDVDESGTINVKDLQDFLKRKGDNISTEQAKEMLNLADSKVAMKTTSHTDMNSNVGDRDNNASGSQTSVKEMDYMMFKKYLCEPSPESHNLNYMKQSTLRFSEYKSKISTGLECKKSHSDDTLISNQSQIASMISSKGRPEERFNYVEKGKLPFKNIILIFDVIDTTDFKLKIESNDLKTEED